MTKRQKKSPFLQRIKNLLSNYNQQVHASKKSNATREEDYVVSETSNQDTEPILINTSDVKYYGLRPERSINDQKYTKPVENWWSSSPPLGQDTAMVC